MKNRSLLSVAIIVTAMLLTGAVKAQGVKGTNYVNAGIGIGTFGFNGTGGLPITASYEHGFSDVISAGVYGGFIQTKYADNWKYKYSVVGLRGSYHFNEVLNVNNPKLDLYGGVSLYYRGYTLKYEESGEGGPYKYKVHDGGVDFAIHAAARYMFSEHIGAYGEVGYGISPLQLGVSVKF